MTELTKWCEHIHNWGNAFYFVDTHDPFPVLAISKCEYVIRPWMVCPICLEKAPEIKGEKEAGKCE